MPEDEVLAWPYRQQRSADLDGDRSAEIVVLACDVSFSSQGAPLWEDGHRWALVIQDRRAATLAYAAFVPHGSVEVAVLQPSSEGRRDVLVQEHSRDRLRALTIGYAGEGRARSVSAAHYQVEAWLPAVATRPGIRFNPTTLTPGSRVGALVVRSVEARRAVDGSFVGSVRFEGELRLTGHRMAHHEPELGAVCFEADQGSAAALPRWPGDERRAWFCFENGEEAAALLERPGAIVIDRFTLHRGLSDEVNSARLRRIVPAHSAPPARDRTRL